MTAAEAAAAAHHAGLCVMPPRDDGTKRPDGTWRQYQQHRPTQQQIDAWYSNGRPGIGLLCGEISGGLEMLELEGRAVNEGVWKLLCARVAEAGLSDVLDRICNGYFERTPSGGVHMLYRCDEIEGNRKLARRHATPDELAHKPDEKIKALIETRGEGGFTIVAPSAGTVHPNGGAWTLVKGGFDTIATITPEERRAIFGVCRSIDQLADTDTTDTKPAVLDELWMEFRSRDGGERWIDTVVDDYNTSTTWGDVLAGWQHTHTTNNIGYWVRPGKNARDGHSATTNATGTDRLIVFSTSTPFDCEPHDGKMPSYDRFGAYAVINHNGDRVEAARTLRDRGYGRQRTGDPARPAPPRQDSDTAEPDPADTWNRRWVSGDTFILDQPAGVPAVWGAGDEVLWAQGEPCIIAGPTGVGKTTVAGQIIMARLGVHDGPVLGYPVATTDTRVLYIAADRPRQAARALRRMVGEENRPVLADRLVFWKGPPPDVARDPEILLRMCREAGADTVVLDSIKDMAAGISKDEVGAALNLAVQNVIAADIEVLGLHHQRKGQNGEKPRTLEDVYGSTWITAGAGSVVLLWGAAGDAEVELVHLKQPASEVGPLKILHDADAGHTTVIASFDPLHFLRQWPNGATAEDAAKAMTGKSQPNKNEVHKARRKLQRLVADGLAREVSGGQTEGVHGSIPSRYVTVDPTEGVIS